MSRIARFLKLGKWKNLKGYDIQGNKYFEIRDPLAHDKEDPRFTKRWVEYKEMNKPLSEYRGDQLPIQWVSWLQHTRLESPNMQELTADHQRQIELKENVARLEVEYKAEKERARLQQPPSQSVTKARPDDTSPATKGTPVSPKLAPNIVEEQRDREEEELIRKRKHFQQSPLSAFAPPGQVSSSHLFEEQFSKAAAGRQ